MSIETFNLILNWGYFCETCETCSSTGPVLHFRCISHYSDTFKEVVMIKILTVTLSLFSTFVVVHVTVADEGGCNDKDTHGDTVPVLQFRCSLHYSDTLRRL